MAESTPPPTDNMDPRDPIDCPVCKSRMTQSMVGAIAIDRCGTCNGIWLDMLEKEQLLADPKAARAADVPATDAPHAASQAKLLCPRDHSRLITMVDLEQPHVKFESCTVCGGTFLYAGELADLSEFTLRERVRRFFHRPAR